MAEDLISLEDQIELSTERVANALVDIFSGTAEAGHTVTYSPPPHGHTKGAFQVKSMWWNENLAKTLTSAFFTAVEAHNTRLDTFDLNSTALQIEAAAEERAAQKLSKLGFIQTLES